MPEKPWRGVVVEGQDDFRALRGLLASEQGGVKPKEKTPRNTWQAEYPHVRLQILASDSKTKLAQRCLDIVESADTRPERIAVVFDPDDASLDDEFEFFVTDFARVRLAHPGIGELKRAEGGSHSFQVAEREHHVYPAPWRSDSDAPFDQLAVQEHNLERVLITGVLAAEKMEKAVAATRGWAEQTTSQLVRLVQGHGWKRAFRIWNAALAPDAEAFVDQLLQIKETKRTCLEALAATRAAEVIRGLLLA